MSSVEKESFNTVNEQVKDRAIFKFNIHFMDQQHTTNILPLYKGNGATLYFLVMVKDHYHNKEEVLDYVLKATTDWTSGKRSLIFYTECKEENGVHILNEAVRIGSDLGSRAIITQMTELALFLDEKDIVAHPFVLI